MKYFTRSLCILGAILTLISLAAPNNWNAHNLDHPIILFFITPYILILVAFNVQLKINKITPKIHTLTTMIIIIFSIFTHYAGHKYQGNSYGGFEWLGAYIVAAIGNLLGLILLIKAILQYKSHNKSFKPTPKSGAV